MLDAQRRPFFAGLTWGAVHSALLALAFPPLQWWILSLFAVAPLVYVCERTSRPFRTALGASLASLGFWCWTHWWVWEVSAAGTPVLLVYLSLYPGLFAWLSSRLPRTQVAPLGILMTATLWTGLEMLRGEVVFHGYPWYLVGQPLINASFKLPGATLGMYGASFYAAFFSAAVSVVVARHARPRPRAKWLSAMLIGLFAVLWLPLSGGPDIRRLEPVGVVQTNVPQSNKDFGTFDDRLRDFSTALRLTSEAAHSLPRPRFIVWPETMFPGTSLAPEAVAEERRSGLGYPSHNFPLTGWNDELVRLQRDLDIPMLVGAIAVDGLKINTEQQRIRFEQSARYNSAFLIVGGVVQTERYDKMFLTPFGETMPYISASKWLEQKLLALGAEGMTFDLGAGSRPVRLLIPGAARVGSGTAAGEEIRVAAPICFEATMPAVVRRLVFEGSDRKADLLVNLTNDGWFGPSVAGRENHLLCARWRCLELGTPMIRAANTGISCLIDSTGEVTQLGPNASLNDSKSVRGALVEGVMNVTVGLPAPGRETAYSRFGNVAGWTCFWVMLVGLAATFLRGPATGSRSDQASPVGTAPPVPSGEKPVNSR